MLRMIRAIYVVKELVFISISNISVTIVLLSFVSLTVVRYFFIVSETEIVSNIGNKKCVPAENRSKKCVNRDGDCY
jgi:hypothetical protein